MKDIVEQLVQRFNQGDLDLGNLELSKIWILEIEPKTPRGDDFDIVKCRDTAFIPYLKVEGTISRVIRVEKPKNEARDGYEAVTKYTICCIKDGWKPNEAKVYQKIISKY
eukprot:gnl/MRDRNA2_/MRDRNA2_81431_c0_seq1.p1 gnl/MRDRNA2_/MRDRNA2_81431_c0~~gnl/MRDRNA2_/MRDRNA2_81431_c0_seq1.p1  ORF type:complete len:110 (+),score=9.62 gnl/MRDRNA2_/MRDRNA2_81431_c0_seq1:385-714(+)